MNKFLLLCCFCLPLRHLKLTSGYGYRAHPVTGKYAFHSGVDLFARHDTVFAVMPGSVVVMGYDPVSGVHVRLACGDFQFFYGHLSQVFVLAGDAVATGSPLGLTGATGRVTGEHLHFAVSFRGQPVNPVHFLNGLINNLNNFK